MDWYRFHRLAYQADTMHLSCLEHGAYRLLIDHYMATRLPIADSDQAMANICRLSQDEWLKISATIRAFFRAKNGRLHNKRCDSELDWQDREAQKRSEHAKNAAEKRWNDIKAQDAASMPPASGEHAQRMLDDARGEERIREEKKESPDAPSTSSAPAREKSRANGRGGNGHDQSTRGTRLDPGWRPSPEDTDFAQQLGLDAEAVASEFRDFWKGVPGAKGLKLDWSATFRVRCRQVAERQRGPGAQGRGSGRTQRSSVDEAVNRVVEAADQLELRRRRL